MENTFGIPDDDFDLMSVTPDPVKPAVAPRDFQKIAEKLVRGEKQSNQPEPLFKVGDVVRLKSGGPKMTVERSTTEWIYVIWMDAAGNIQRGILQPCLFEFDQFKTFGGKAEDVK